jgi:hypothetical protein
VATYLTQSLPAETVQMGFQQPFVSNSVNRKDAGVLPSGIYRGFTPGAVGLTLTLAKDPAEGDSVAVVNALSAILVSSRYSTTVNFDEDVVLDFTAVPNGTYVVVLEVRYDLIGLTPVTGLTEVRIKIVDPIDVLPQHVILLGVTRLGVLLTLDLTIRNETGGILTGTEFQTAFEGRLKIAIGTNPAYPGVNGGAYNLAVIHNFGLSPGSIVPIDSKNVGFLTDKGFMLVQAYATGWSGAQHYSNSGVVYVLPPGSWGDPANQIVVTSGTSGKGGIAFVVVIQLHPDVIGVSNSFIPGPYLTATPDPVIYPNTITGMFSDMTIQVGNAGDTAFTVTSVTLPAVPFVTITPSIVGTVIPPGPGTVPITVRFSPILAINYTSNIVITNSAAQVVDVGLDGTGV